MNVGVGERLAVNLDRSVGGGDVEIVGNERRRDGVGGDDFRPPAGRGEKFAIFKRFATKFAQHFGDARFFHRLYPYKQQAARNGAQRTRRPCATPHKQHEIDRTLPVSLRSQNIGRDAKRRRAAIPCATNLGYFTQTA